MRHEQCEMFTLERQVFGQAHSVKFQTFQNLLFWSNLYLSLLHAMFDLSFNLI